MRPLNTLRQFFGNVARSAQLLAEIREGIGNLTDVTNKRLAAIEAQLQPQSDASVPPPGTQATRDARNAVSQRMPDVLQPPRAS